MKAIGLTYFGKTSWSFLCKALIYNAKLDLLNLPEEIFLILYSLDGLESTDIWWPVSWLCIPFSYVIVVCL